MTAWDDLAARARGLGAHVLEPAALQRLATAPDPGRLAAGLRGTPYAPHLRSPRPTPTELETALRERVSDALRIVALWAGPARLERLAPLFEDEDRRSLRVLLRGAVGGTPAESRLRGLLPTAGLPTRILTDASRAGGLESLAAVLSRWDHPLARAVAPLAAAEAARTEPDLYGLEVALARVWASRARETAKGGGPLLRTFVRETLDEANLTTVLARARSPAGSGETPFLEGGRWLDAGAFRKAVEVDDREASARLLRTALSGTPFRGLPSAGRGRSVEETLLSRAAERWKERSRQAPVGPAPVIHFWLRLRREAAALRRLVWAGGLGAPPAERLSGAAS